MIFGGGLLLPETLVYDFGSPQSMLREQYS
jgi:hypothetical protein